VKSSPKPVPLAELHRDEGARLKRAETPGEADAGRQLRRTSSRRGAESDRHDGSEGEDDRDIPGEMQVRVPRLREDGVTACGVGDRDEIREEMADDQAHEGEAERRKVAEMASFAHGTCSILRADPDERERHGCGRMTPP
jgi:hypothetical protein